MNEQKCSECGAIIPEGMTECPSCGCPIATVSQTPAPVSHGKKALPVNILAIISLLLGFAIIFMGVNVKNKSIVLNTYSAKHYDVDYAKFGADFYTEIYKASDVMVDELDDINSGIAELSKSMSQMAGLVYYPAGMLIIAVGLGVVAVSLPRIKKDV